MTDWQPGAANETLRQRADLHALIRRFFAARDVLEVETPLLASTGVTDPALEPLLVTDGLPAGESQRYLQTSPEYAMKRLLAAGSGPIYQLGKAFRAAEVGRRHNPEFTLLEWYRPGFSLEQLMEEVADLVIAALGPRPWQVLSYRELFEASLGLDPFTASLETLRGRARQQVDTGSLEGDRDLWLDLLLTHAVEPWLAGQGLCFVRDYPATQAALARVRERDGHRVGERFELYVDGLELANGYRELVDAREQHRRFLEDNRRRREVDLPERPLDEALLAALEAGLPDCSGVALGVDRLLMCLTGESDIRRVLAFDWTRS